MVCMTTFSARARGTTSMWFVGTLNGSSGLPSFDQPPVVETVAAVEFAPLQTFGFASFTRFALTLADDYPVLEEKEALGITPRMIPQGPTFELAFVPGPPPVRLWLYGADPGWLVQLQNDRLILNWRAAESQGPYPRYPSIKDHFFELWKKLILFLEENDLESPVPLVVDFTYVNRIEVEAGAGPASAFSFLRAPETDLPGDALFTRFQMVRDVPATGTVPGGQLVLTGEPDFREGEAYSVTVSTRLSLASGTSDTELESTMDLARSIGVRAFAGVTTEEKHDEWGRSK